MRTPADFIKALTLGADGIALANAAKHAVGCVGARRRHTNNCPAGIATQKPELRTRLDVDAGAERLARSMTASVELMEVMVRACAHDTLSAFNRNDLPSWRKDVADLAGIDWTGRG